MDPDPDLGGLSTEQLLTPVGVPLVTLIEVYKLLISVAMERDVDRPEAYRLATALLPVITAAQGPADVG
jgi:hypothetical protein